MVWLDDLHAHLEHGLAADQIQQLLAVDGQRIVATMPASAFEATKGSGDLKPHAWYVVHLAEHVAYGRWDEHDREQATAQYAVDPDATDVVEALRAGVCLGEYLSMVPELLARLGTGTPSPTGVAVVRAVADWYRAGLNGGAGGVPGQMGAGVGVGLGPSRSARRAGGEAQVAAVESGLDEVGGRSLYNSLGSFLSRT